MPEDGFVFTSVDPDTRNDSAFAVDLGAGDIDLRKMTNAISKEVSLVPLRDMPDGEDAADGHMPGDDFWL